MKKLLSFTMILALLLCLVIPAVSAYSEEKTTEDGCYRYRIVDNKNVVLERCLKTPEVEDATAPYTIPSEIDGFKVTVLGNWLYKSYDVPSSKVIIPDTVTHIGYEAFSYESPVFDDDSLYYEDYRDELEKLRNDPDNYSRLEEITIPSSVTSIEGGAFSNCRKLKSAVIPESVMYMGGGVFRDCKALKTAEIKSDYLSQMPRATFSGCNSLQRVELPEKMWGEEYCFEGCPLNKQVFDDNTLIFVSSMFGMKKGSTPKKTKPIKNYIINMKYTGTFVNHRYALEYADRYGMKAIYNITSENRTYKFTSGQYFKLKIDGNYLTGWKSSDPKVIKVDKNGNVSVYRKGTATLTADLPDGTKYTSTFKSIFDPDVRGIVNGNYKNLSKTTFKLKKGEKLELLSSYKLKHVDNVYKNTKVAKVISKNSAEDIKIKALKTGSTTVKIRVNNTWFKVNIKVK